MTRILITGSRTWDRPDVIRDALLPLIRSLGAEELTVVHGACPDGADIQADTVCRDLGIHVERHPANWAQHGRRAGYLRNRHMVDAGAELCFAFIRNGSRGASMCADLAESAGINTYRWLAP